MSKKFDSVTAKKLLAEYAEKVTHYMRENQMLTNQVEDLKTSLGINKELLFKYISGGLRQDDHVNAVNDIKAENQALVEKNNRLIKENMNAEQKLQKLHQAFEDSTLLLRDEMEKVKEEIFLTKNKLLEKEALLMKLVKELEIYSKGTSDGSNRKEIYITDPTRVNVDLNNELNYTRDILAKVSKMHNQEKVKSNKLESQARALQGDIESMKKTVGLNQISNAPSAEEVKSGYKQTKTLLKDECNDSNISDNLSFEEFESEGDVKENEDDDCGIKFPDKVKMNSIQVNLTEMAIAKQNMSTVPNAVGHCRTKSAIPKLDLNKISSQNQCERAKGKQNSIENTKQVFNPKDQEIERLKNELKQRTLSLEDMKARITKFKNVYKNMKRHISDLNEQIKNANLKIEGLELQLKKFVLPSTDDLSSNKNNFNDNNSMNNNTSAIHEEAECD